MPFIYFSEGENKVFIFSFQGRRVTRRNQTHAEYVFSYFAKQKVLLENKNNAPSLTPDLIKKQYKQLVETIFLLQRKMLSLPCQFGFSRISGSPANLPGTRKPLSLSPNLNLSLWNSWVHMKSFYLFFETCPSTMAEL